MYPKQIHCNDNQFTWYKKISLNLSWRVSVSFRILKPAKLAVKKELCIYGFTLFLIHVML